MFHVCKDVRTIHKSFAKHIEHNLHKWSAIKSRDSPDEVKDSKEGLVGIANSKSFEIYDDPEIPCTMTIPEF